MDGSLRRRSVPPAVPSAEDTCDREARHASFAGGALATTGSTIVVQSASADGVTCFAKDGETTYLGTHDHGKRDAKLLRPRGDVLETLLDDGRSRYCGLCLEPGCALWALGGEPAPGRYGEGGLLYLIDLAAAERCIAGNLEYHIVRWTQAHDGQPPPQAGVLRQRFGGGGAEASAADAAAAGRG